MQSLSPKRLEPDAWKSWLRQAARLLWRHSAVLVLAGTLVLALLTAATIRLDLWLLLVLSSVIAQSLTALFLYLAALQDFRFLLARHSLPEWLRLCARVVLSGGISSLILIAMYALLFVFLLWLDTPGQQTAPGSGFDDEPVFNPYLVLVGLGLVVFPLLAYYIQSLLPGLSIWFVLPLVLYFRLGLVHAMRLSHEAEKLNWESVNASIILVLVGLIAVLLSGGLATVVVVPLIACLQLISFHEVFIGPVQHPQKVSAKVESAAPNIRV